MTTFSPPHKLPSSVLGPAAADDRERQKLARRHTRRQRLFGPAALRPALVRSFVMLDPRRMARNPVMATCDAGAALTMLIAVQSAWTGRPRSGR